MAILLGLMMKILDIPKELRPREKALFKGIDSLSEIELLSLILGSGTKGINVLQLSSNILENCGGLASLCEANLATLKSQKGISEAKAFSLLATFELAKRIAKSKPYEDSMNPKELYEHYKNFMSSFDDERLYILIYNRSKNILRESLISKGKGSSSFPTEKEIKKELVAIGGNSFILIHNHPSGLPLPSEVDIRFTKQVEEEMEKEKLKFLDHIIFSERGYYSFKENGLLS